MLTENLSNYASRVVIQNQALSNQVGTASFFVVGAGLGTNSLHQGNTPVESSESVRLNTVDAYCQEAKISRIDLLKIDAEGHDLLVLKGARSMFQSRAISLVQFEYNQRWIYSRHFLKDAFDLLQPLGYSLGKITRKGIEFYPGWHFELESFREGNYLACLPEFRDRFPQVKWWNLP
jgi:FkbM family methyltransferase